MLAMSDVMGLDQDTMDAKSAEHRRWRLGLHLLCEYYDFERSGMHGCAGLAGQSIMIVTIVCMMRSIPAS